MTIKTKLLATVSALTLLSPFASNATTITMNSLTSAGELSSEITEVGGIVLDIIGLNGTRVTSQLASSSLFDGYTSSTYTTIGTQTGFTSSVTDLLGGGILELAIRVTLYDGDTSSGDFDEDDNYFYLNDISIGNWSDVLTQTTNSTGTSAGSTEYGFGNYDLDTGWFYSDDSSLLTALYETIISTEEVVYSLFDTDPGDNYLDFTRGVDGGLVNVSSAPTATTQPTAVSEPATLALFGLGLLGVYARKKKLKCS